MGLGLIYDADGKIIGYEVEEGQGPTQIAQDLNENYGCVLTCEITFTDIVGENQEAFQDVVEGDGEANDKNNEDFKSGNISVGDILNISQGIDVSSEVEAIKELDNDISELQEDSAHKVEVWLLDLKVNSGEAIGEPVSAGPRAGGIVKNIILHQRPYDKTMNKLQKSRSSRDSLKQVVKKKTNSNE